MVHGALKHSVDASLVVLSSPPATMSGSVGIIANQSDAVKRGIAGIEKWIFVGARHETWDAGLDMRQQTWVASHVSCLMSRQRVSRLMSRVQPRFPLFAFSQSSREEHFRGYYGQAWQRCGNISSERSERRRQLNAGCVSPSRNGGTPLLHHTALWGAVILTDE